jgi:hypothetical protein
VNTKLLSALSVVQRVLDHRVYRKLIEGIELELRDRPQVQVLLDTDVPPEIVNGRDLLELGQISGPPTTQSQANSSRILNAETGIITEGPREGNQAEWDGPV